MSQKIQILSAVLVIQLILTIVLIFTGKDTGAFASSDKLIGLKLDEFDKIAVIGNDNQSTLLHKQGDSWMMTDYFNFPADPKKVRQITDELFAISEPWPVATTDAAGERFKVAGDNFERKIAFSNGDNVLQTLYLGTSPGYRKVHARMNDEDEIYAIEFGVFKASAEGKDWAKKDFLHIPNDNITQITLGEVTLQREGDALQVMGLGDTEVTNVEEAGKLSDKIASLNFSEVLATADKPEFQQNTPVMEIELSLKDADPVKYTFSNLQDNDDYVLKRSDSDYHFKIPKYAAEEIVTISRSALVKMKPAEPAAPAAPEPGLLSDVPKGVDNDNPVEAKVPQSTIE